MLSTEFGNMNKIRSGFNPAEIGDHYGSKIHVWSWSDKKLLKTLDMGPDLIPLEVRFLHRPDAAHAFVVRFQRRPCDALNSYAARVGLAV
jgi:selenium-binding protein 1